MYDALTALTGNLGDVGGNNWCSAVEYSDVVAWFPTTKTTDSQDKSQESSKDITRASILHEGFWVARGFKFYKYQEKSWNIVLRGMEDEKSVGLGVPRNGSTGELQTESLGLGHWLCQVPSVVANTREGSRKERRVAQTQYLFKFSRLGDANLAYSCIGVCWSTENIGGGGVSGKFNDRILGLRTAEIGNIPAQDSWPRKND